MPTNSEQGLVTALWSPTGRTKAYLREKGEQDSCLKNCFSRCGYWFFFSPECKRFPSRESILGASPSPFWVTQITSWSIISLTSLLCSNYKGEKDDCKAIRAAIIFVKTFPTVLFPSISYHLFSFFSCNPMCAFLCTLFLHSSAVLFLISPPFSHVPNASLHFGENFTNVYTLKWEEPGIF